MNSDRRGTTSVDALGARPNNRVFPSDAQQSRAVETCFRSLPTRLTYRYDADGRRWSHFVGNVPLGGGAPLLALLGGIWRRGQYEPLWTTDGHLVKALFVVTLEIGVHGKDCTVVVVLFPDTVVALPVTT